MRIFLRDNCGTVQKIWDFHGGNKTSSALHKLYINIIFNVFSSCNCKVATCEVMQIDVNN